MKTFGAQRLEPRTNGAQGYLEPRHLGAQDQRSTGLFGAQTFRSPVRLGPQVFWSTDQEAISKHIVSIFEQKGYGAREPSPGVSFNQLFEEG